jgi:hypothetical protein
MRRKPLAIASLILACVALSGCASSDKELMKFWEPAEAGLVCKKIPAVNVRLENAPFKPPTESEVKAYMRQGYSYLGSIAVVGPMISNERIRKFVADRGGDHVIRKSMYAGEETGSRMVVGSYTPGTVASSNSLFNGSVNTSSSGSVYGSGGSAYWNGNNNSQISGTGTTSTYIPGQTTYVRENFRYPVFAQAFTVLQSKHVFLSNAKAWQLWFKNTKGINLTLEQVAKLQQDVADKRADQGTASKKGKQ